MGWTYPTGVSRQELIEQRTKSWEREINGVRDGEQVERTQRWITCDLIRCHAGDWGYKDMQEAEHPYYYSCPQKYLDLVPIEQYGGHAEWRDEVRHRHQERLENKRNTKSQSLT